MWLGDGFSEIVKATERVDSAQGLSHARCEHGACTTICEVLTRTCGTPAEPCPGPCGSNVVIQAPTVDATVPRSFRGATAKSRAVSHRSRMMLCVLDRMNASASVVKLVA